MPASGASIGVASVDRGIDDSRAWLRELADGLGWGDPQQTWNALRAVLHTVRDELPPGDVVLLGEDLPVLLRGALYEGWTTRRVPQPLTFLERVEDRFPLDLAEVEAPTLVAAVLRVIGHHVPAGRCAQVWRELPPEVRALWRGASRFLG